MSEHFATDLLAERHAVVIGAGRGIGRSIALAFAQAGATVTLAARTHDELVRTATDIEAAGGRAFVEPLDATDEVAVDAAIRRAESASPISILVTAAGTNRAGPSETYTLEDWRVVLATNLEATFLACRAFGRTLLAATREGAVVTISSQMGTVGYPGRAAYCASKHAVNGLTKALAVEWAPHRIRVNAVAPTFVQTALTAPMLASEIFRTDVLQRIPAGRIGETDDITGAVLYLASDAARLVTGHVLAVDGGWVAW